MEYILKWILREQERLRTYSVILRRVRVTVVVMEKLKELHNFLVCVCVCV